MRAGLPVPAGRWRRFALAVALLLWPRGAVAGDYFQPRLAIGPSITTSGDPGGELTLQWSLFGPHLSVGVSGVEGDRSYVYGELAASLWLTVGAGAGGLLGEQRSAAFHGFVGLPLPLLEYFPDRGWTNLFFVSPGHGHAPPPRILIYVEPYLRGVSLDGFDDFDHQFGLAIKLSAARARGPN